VAEAASLTPNWQSRLPGYAYDGPDPNGYMRVTEVVGYLKRYADFSGAPVQSRTKVTRVRQLDTGYEVTTDQGIWRCQTLVVASGACNIATVPAVAAGLPPEIASLTPMHYRNPESLPDGGVIIVGASATGVQLAREIRASGRSVMLAAGEHVRVPRVYRGRDIKWWMEAIGAMDLRYDAIDDVDRARRLPSLQLIGTPGRENIDLNSLRKAGVEIVGRVAGMRDGKMQFSASLPNHCALADLKMNRLLASIDAWILATGQQDYFPTSHRFEPTEIDPQARLGMDLNDGSVRTVIWATGFRPDYSWLDVPVFDRKGRIRHNGGVVAAPGMYVMGLPFMRRRKSSFIDGAADDAADLAAHLTLGLRRLAA
jgi:putative flavoprotein involved in K+ transport